MQLNRFGEKEKIETLQHIPRTGELIELASIREDYDSNFSITEDGELLSLLEQPRTSFGECNLPAVCILDPLYLNLPPPHFSSSDRRKKGPN